ncbi:alcohol dehydrogenase [Rhodococcus sp. 14-2496-1d]|uniref:NAD(P)-dependent alcohol dehydrogenase n=1 Tax=Rhodococcus sp. 14-2496-1d TaxID=2023146 RepID=UPI000B9B7219|nr:NAD(P)-dependent alcohol dehydrogenase [Rhodococcus sp. 14-2496-1d]OZF25677.1 alcohol dehydrogenase [Rhodococcus sp. 14-2496-1d]
MTLAHARGVTGKDQPFAPMEIARRAVGPHDVEIDIAFCGLCHSDVDRAREIWGATKFPIVPGHEIVGHVRAVGDQVTGFAVGDRAAVGCMVNSCQECDRCREGLEQYCRKGNTQTYNWIDRDGTVTQGGYSDRVVVDDRYVLHLPDGMPMDTAAPLLCAGITLYSPLRHWNVGPGTRVGIVGFGGLGHVGVQISAAMGAHTVVFDLAEEKRGDALRLGADEFHLTTEPDVFTDLADSLDLIISTVPANLDYNAFLSTLTLNGTFVIIGVPKGPITAEAFHFISHRRSIAGTRIGSIGETQEMLDFCAEHNIGAEIELVGADEIDASYDRLVKGDVRYRFVLDIATLGAKSEATGHE